jgi:hypothetical protein
MAFADWVKRWLRYLAPIWIPALLTGVAWAADHYIDDRINSKLAVVEKRLAEIELELVEIKTILRDTVRPQQHK